MSGEFAPARDWFIEHLPQWVLAVIGTLVAWFAKRAINKVDRQEARIAALEQKSVTKDDIDDLRESMNQHITRSMERIERRTDQILFHMAKDDQ